MKSYIKYIFIFSVLNFFITPIYGQKKKQDILEKTLSNYHLDISDLGYNPKTYWTGFPQNIPYKFHAFDDLFAEPLKMYDYTKTISSSVEICLSPQYVEKNNSFLYNTAYFTAISKHLGAFRGFPPIHRTKTKMEDSFIKSLKQIDKIYRYHHPNTNIKTTYDTEAYKEIPLPISHAIAELIFHISTAYHWQQIAIRNLDTNKMKSVFKIRNFGLTQTDALRYHPEFDDCAQLLDEESMFYSSSKALAAIDFFRFDLDSILSNNDYDFSQLNIEIQTPMGLILLNGSMDNVYDGNIPYLLIIDFGGNDSYNNSVAASTSIHHPLSIVIDYTGDDIYNNENAKLLSQGAAIFGTGVLLDMGGNDQYKSINYSQGLGVFGIGLLCDLNGDDTYKMENSGQGCGYFGIGLNFDITGNDTYYIFGDGQGMGGVGGVGILANHSGDDFYHAESDATKCKERADYHSKNKIIQNNAQGAGMGRRGDLSDGHNWAGGIGALIDINGDDHYLAGNFSQAVGYWFGMGILFDGKGDDLYESVYFTQASGAHFAMGIMIDEFGNDKHILTETGGAGLSFGWDFVNTIFLDAHGDDYYETKMISLANSMLRSNSLFIEMEGNDTYKCGSLKNFLGASEPQDFFTKPAFNQVYFYEAKQFSLFFDLKGDDLYYFKERPKGKWQTHPFAKNNSKWLQPTKKEAIKSNNFGIGIDATTGSFNQFKHWEKD